MFVMRSTELENIGMPIGNWASDGGKRGTDDGKVASDGVEAGLDDGVTVMLEMGYSQEKLLLNLRAIFI